MSAAALFTVAKARKQTKGPSTGDRTRRLWHTDTTESYAATREEETLSSVTAWTDPERCRAKRNTSGGKGQGPRDFTQMWDVKRKATDEQNQSGG